LASEVNERLHRLFCASMEFAKWARRAELLVWTVGTVFVGAAFVLFGDQRWTAYLPPVGLLAVVGGAALRYTVRRHRSYGETCKRLSIRAYALDDAPPAKAASDVFDGAPWGTRLAARRMAATSIDAYYEATRPVGMSRMVEMYGAAAYFSARLLELHARWLLFGSAATVLVALCAFYVAGTGVAPNPGDAVKVGKLILSLLVGGIGLLFFERGIDALGAAKAIRVVEDKLLVLPLDTPPSEEVWALTRDYDSELRASPLIPTRWYRLRRDALNRGWAERRRVWAGVAPPTPMAKQA
jgi:hypothetical protein